MLPILFFALIEVLKYSSIYPNRRFISSFISAALASTILYMLTLPKFDFSTKTMFFEILLPQTATSSDAFLSILLSVFSLFIIKERLISISKLSQRFSIFCTVWKIFLTPTLSGFGILNDADFLIKYFRSYHNFDYNPNRHLKSKLK